MSRVFNEHTVQILESFSKHPGAHIANAFPLVNKSLSYKEYYNTIYRLVQQELLERKNTDKGICLWVTKDGLSLLGQYRPEKDSEWKIIIFDIPEKQKYVRTVLRAKLKTLHFKKWQNSIWISPYKLNEEIEQELMELGKKFFIRLIKTKDISHTEDLEKMFAA